MKTNRILAIAISEYDDHRLNKIENCYSDISEIIQILNDKYKFEDVDFIYEKSKTTRKILFQKINEYFKNCLDDDNVLILFAGHGEFDDSLGLSYWLPSDADLDDSTSWININTFVKLLKVCKARHISIISDSCFSGAIFEELTRGGGLEALDNKKSREALTSGGIEKVSDGAKGKGSPFTETLIKILKENSQNFLPFNQLANSVIVNFDPKRKQTPAFGSLDGVGHDGGTLILEIKVELVKKEFIDDKNNYLKSKLTNLFIEIPVNALKFIDELHSIRKVKTTAVREQKYTEAAVLRDREIVIEKEIIKLILENIALLAQKIVFSKEKIDFMKGLDNQILEIENHNEQIRLEYAKKKERAIVRDRGTKHRNLFLRKGIGYKKPLRAGISSNQIIEYEYFSKLKVDPAVNYILNYQSDFVKKYESNILELYLFFKELQCVSESTFIKSKSEKLMNILNSIVMFEINMITERIDNSLDEKIGRIELENKILLWIKNSE